MNREIIFKNYGLKPVNTYTLLLLKYEVMLVNKDFFYEPTEDAAERLFKLLERWRKRKK